MTPLTTLPLSEIHPRDHFNYRQDLPKIKELAASIAAVGLLTPIMVEKNGAGYHIVSGHRRYSALTLLGFTGEVPVTLKGDVRSEIANLVENVREEPHPADLAVRLRDVVDGKFGDALKPKDLATQIGLSASHVNNLVRIAKKLTPESLQAWRDGEGTEPKVIFPFALALKMCGMSEEQQALAIEAWRDSLKEANHEGSEEDEEEDAPSEGEETASEEGDDGAPSKAEMRAKLENLEAKESLTEEQNGMRRALRWALGMTKRM